jgi:IclR family transcriptional regulator, KDG regulon repressor
MNLRKNDTGKRKLIQSIERAADILELFIKEKRSLGIADIARLLDLPRPTIQGIVNTLIARGYLEKDLVNVRYRLGPMLFQLGMKYATNLDLVNIARGWTERLCFQFNQPVNVGMIVGERVVVVLRIEPENKFMVFPQAGSVIPSHSTCIGKILFAFMEEEPRNELLSGYSFEQLTPNSITTRQKFNSELTVIRREDIAFDNEENIIGLAGIGAPIRNHLGQVIAAFAITGNAKIIHKRREEIIISVRYTSKMISSQLGYSEENS